MSGYCRGCGNTLCICDQITSENMLDSSKCILIEASLIEQKDQRIKELEDGIEKIMSEISGMSSRYPVYFELKKLINKQKNKGYVRMNEKEPVFCTATGFGIKRLSISHIRNNMKTLTSIARKHNKRRAGKYKATATEAAHNYWKVVEQNNKLQNNISVTLEVLELVKGENTATMRACILMIISVLKGVEG